MYPRHVCPMSVQGILIPHSGTLGYMFAVLGFRH